MNQKRNITITAPHGLVPYLKNEITALGYPILWTGDTAIGTTGTYRDTMYLNLWLRTAHHILYQIQEFDCSGLETLYKNVSKFPWENLISVEEIISVTASVDHPSIRDHRIVNLKCKDAIVDRISSYKKLRPNSGPDRTGVVITVFWRNNRCSIAIDTSGEPLSKRGYRMIPMSAPMQETLAAALVYATGYSGNEPFINPMCGSGTIAIEAALIGTNTAPGLTRKNFGFMHTLHFDNSVWEKMRNDALSMIRRVPKEFSVIATDNNPEAIDAAKRNAISAHMDHYITFIACDFTETVIPAGSGGVVIFNPEYGIRLGDEMILVSHYRKIGKFMKHVCQGYRGFVFTGNAKLAGNIGLKSGRKIDFQSGKIDCRLYQYDLYKGKIA